jgi:hypothetical protein
MPYKRLTDIDNVYQELLFKQKGKPNKIERTHKKKPEDKMMKEEISRFTDALIKR